MVSQLSSEKGSTDKKGPESSGSTREITHDASDQIPNGGFRAWLQVVAAFFIFFNTSGLFNSFGVYQAYYMNEPLSTISGSNISWIGSLQGCLLLLLSIAAGPLYDLGYLHTLVNLGSFTVVFGMMMASLCHSYWQFIVAQGLLVGIGNGLLFLPSIAIVPQYFSTRKALATGIVSAGSSFGAVIYPIVFIRVAPINGYQWASRALAFVMMATSIVTAIVIRSRVKPSVERRRIFDIASFRDPPFVFFCVSMCLGFMGIYILYFFIVLYAIQECQMGQHLAPYTVAMVNAGSALGRVLPSYTVDKVGPLNCYVPFTLIAGLLAFCWIAVHNSAGLIVFCILYGVFSGPFVSLIGPTIVEISAKTPELIGTRLGMSLAFAGLGLLIGSPVAGAIVESHGWVGQQIFAGSLVLASGLCLLAVRASKVGWVIMARV